MPVFFKVEFHCESCGADIVYEDELPKIFKDRVAIVENNKAERWLKKYGGKRYGSSETAYKDVQPPIPRPPDNVVLSHELYLTFEFSAYPDKVKYIICTVCGERIYFG